MIDVRKVLTLLACGCLCLTVTTTALADFVGVVVENKVDDLTVLHCGGADPPLTVCNVSIQFGDDNDRLLSMAFSDIFVLGAAGAQFNHHEFGLDTAYSCALLGPFPDLRCDSYVTIGEKCLGIAGVATEEDFSTDEFNNNGHIVGGWFNGTPTNGLGDAFGPVNPDGIILVLQTSVAVGLSVEGPTTVFWHNVGDPEVFEEVVQIVCEAKCVAGDDCSDQDNCTENDECVDGICVGTPIDCAFLDDDCNEGVCDPSTDPGTCVQVPTNEGGGCDDGNPCTNPDTCSNGSCGGPADCASDADCDDSNACTNDSCDANGCCSYTDVNCDDKDPCTTDACDEVDGCSNIPDCTADADCNDGLLCTIDTCAGNCCLNTPIECDPGDACNPDNGECEEIPCQDDSDCNDDNDCTADTCEAGVGCVFTPQVGQPCGDPADSDCDGADTCDDTGACNANIADAGTACSGNGEGACTDADTCDGAGGCDNNDVDDGTDCDDDDVCTDGETCSGGECGGGDDPCPDDLTCVPDGAGGFDCQAFTPGFLDIIPGKCPNRLRRNGQGYIKISLVSTEDLDACDVDVSTCVLFRADGFGGTASPVSNPAPRCRDRATPYTGELCGCHSDRKDGIDDLDMKFKVADVVNNLGLGDMPAGVSVELVLECQTDGAPIRASDCVELGRDLGPNP